MNITYNKNNDIRDSIVGRAMANRQYTARELDKFDRQKIDFRKEVGIKFNEKLFDEFDSMDLIFNDDAIRISKTIKLDLMERFDRDKFIPISWNKPETKSLVTKHFIQSNRKMQKLILDGLHDYGEDEIDKVDWLDDEDNISMNYVYEGYIDIDGSDEDMMIEYYEEHNSLDIDYTITDDLQDELIDLDCLITDMLNAGKILQ